MISTTRESLEMAISKNKSISLSQAEIQMALSSLCQSVRSNNRYVRENAMLDDEALDVTRRDSERKKEFIERLETLVK